LFTAQSRIQAVSDYIDTRRGSIGPEARTRLAEASRQLQAAQDKREVDISEAISRANTAATLADQAQSLADDDVRSAQLAYTGRYGGGNNMGAMMGGIIIGDMLGGGGFGGGGFGGGGFAGGGTADDASQITSWVESHFTAETLGGVTVYNLTSGASS
jgi:hypothetical protein